MTECFVSFYDAESATIKAGFVDARVLKGMRLNLAMQHEIGANKPINDEFARRLGGAALLWFAMQHPELRDYLEITDGKGTRVTF